MKDHKGAGNVAETLRQAIAKKPEGLGSTDIEQTLAASGVGAIEGSKLVMDLWAQGEIKMNLERRFVLNKSKGE